MAKANLINPLTKKPTSMKVEPLKKKKLEDVEAAKQKVREKGKPQKKTADGKVKK
jgi:hypothetical protein